MARRLPLEIPQSVEELTAGWLTDAVRSSGLARDARVVAFKAESPGSGVGFQGQTIRVSLDWDVDEPDAPEAVLVKFPSANRGNRGLGEAEGANLADSKVPLLAAAVSGSANSSLDTAGLRAQVQMHVHVHVHV